MSIGTTLLKHRKIKNYSQKQVADLLEVSQSTYCDWESDTATPKTDNILKIAKLYDLDINELLNSDKSINIVNSPNATNINNSPNSKVETPEALLKIAENIERLIMVIEKIVEDKK